MATNKEKFGIDLPVKPKLDKTSTAQLMKDMQSINAKLKTIDTTFRQTSKSANQNISQIKDISKSVDLFAKSLSSGTKKSFKRLKELGDELEKAQDQAAELQSAYKGAKSAPEKAKVAEDFKRLSVHIDGLNKSIKQYQNNNQKYGRQLSSVIKTHQKYQQNLQQAANYSGKNAAGGMFSGIVKALSGGSGNFKQGVGQTVKSAGQGIQGAAARKTLNSSNAGSPQGVSSVSNAGAAMAAVGAAVTSVAAFAKLLMAASDHMASLNKALMKGKGLASEFGAEANEYTKSIENIRYAAIDAHGPMLKLGMDSEQALGVVGDFAKNASGSIVKTESMLRGIGQGNLQQGLFEFVKTAQVYGKALGVEAEEVSSMMGDFVSEIGYSHQNITRVMGDIVKQASQAGIPVTKFMGIFHEAIPNLDLFTNRIDELTGTIKLLSKNMDPKSVKGFMSAMGRGFDQMDFRQRLKMSLVIGPQEMGEIIRTDLKRASAAVRDQLPEALRESFDEALQRGPEAMAKVAAHAQAMGMSGSTIGEMNRISRYKSNADSGDILKQSTSMRDMGLLGRLDALEKYAGKFTGGDLTGIGEHVAAQLGISESEYKALIDMKASLGTYNASILKTGRTSSKSINDSLKHMLKLNRSQFKSDEAFEQAFEQSMRGMASSNPKGLESMIKEAATLQIEEDQKTQKDSEKQIASMEDLAKEQVNASLSISDKIENIIKVLLEKVYYVVDDILKVIGDVYDALPGWITGSRKEESKLLDRWSANASQTLGKENTSSLSYYRSVNTRLKGLSESNASPRVMMQEFAPLIAKQLKSGAVDESTENDMRRMLANVLDPEKIDKFISYSDAGDEQGRQNILGSLDSGEVMKLISSLAHTEASSMKGHRGEIKYGDRFSSSELRSKRDVAQDEIARKTGDLDQRTLSRFRDPLAGEMSKSNETQEEILNKSTEIHDATLESVNQQKRGVKFDQSWMTQKYKEVVTNANLDAFRPALAEFLLAQSRLAESPDMRRTYAGSDGSEMLDLRTIAMQKTKQEMDDAIEMSKVEGHARGGVATYTGLHTLTAGERVLPPGQSGSGNNIRNITINVHSAPYMSPDELTRVVRRAIDDSERHHLCQHPS